MIRSRLTRRPDIPRRYTTFQVVGAWANTGFSLVDQNLVPFQTAYPLLIFMVWLALAGNTGFVSPLVLISYTKLTPTAYIVCGLFHPYNVAEGIPVQSA